MDLIQGWSHLQALKTVLRDHEGTGDPIELRTLVQVVQSIGMPHGLFRQETRGSNISYPDRRVSVLDSCHLLLLQPWHLLLPGLLPGLLFCPLSVGRGLQGLRLPADADISSIHMRLNTPSG